MTNKGPFPFQTVKEAWDYFDKAARLHFVRLIKQESEENEEIQEKARLLRNRDYCARLLYILNIFAYEGDPTSEFDLDWAILIARPLSADQARRSIKDLIELGLMTKVDGSTSNNEKYDEDAYEKRKGFRGGPGGRTNAETEFDFE